MLCSRTMHLCVRLCRPFCETLIGETTTQMRAREKGTENNGETKRKVSDKNATDDMRAFCRDPEGRAVLLSFQCWENSTSYIGPPVCGHILSCILGLFRDECNPSGASKFAERLFHFEQVSRDANIETSLETIEDVCLYRIYIIVSSCFI